MKRRLKLAAAALAAVLSLSCASFGASADVLKTVNGLTCRYSDSGESMGLYTGWVKTKKGLKYSYKGEYLKNKWVTFKSGARFHINADGFKDIGWTHVGKYWYYIDEKKGALTGTQTIDGTVFNFSDKGKWDKTAADGVTDGYTAYFRLLKKLDKKTYGIISCIDSMCVVTSINGQAEKAAAKIYPDGANVIFQKADYSCYEMEKIKDDLFENHRECWTGLGIMNDGLLHVEYLAEQKAALDKYMAGLDNPGCIVFLVSDEAISFSLFKAVFRGTLYAMF